MDANQTLMSAVAAIVNSGAARANTEKADAGLTATMRELFIENSHSDSEFVAMFGNGAAPKAKDFIAGELATEVRQQVAALVASKKAADKDAVAAGADKRALDCLKSRLSECRRLFKLGGQPGKDESIRNAIKRYEKVAGDAKEKAPRPEGNETETFVIPDELTADKLADALSLWITHQTPAKVAALSKKLPDFLPGAESKPARRRVDKAA